MDIPAYNIFGGLLIVIALVIGLRALRLSKIKALGVALIGVVIVWFYLSICGEVIFHWTNSTLCSKYLGCGAGFFGYDAFQHLLSGIGFALLAIWISKRFPKYSVLHTNRWKTLLVIIAIVALVGVLWEMLECAHDVFRLDVLHEHLLNYRFHINMLDQPTNLDTMGDLTANLVGSVIGFFVYLFV